MRYEMELVITVEVKRVYGEEKIYPVCEKALIFAKMVGQKTLTPSNIANIKALGYTIKVSQPEIKL